MQMLRIAVATFQRLRNQTRKHCTKAFSVFVCVSISVVLYKWTHFVPILIRTGHIFNFVSAKKMIATCGCRIHSNCNWMPNLNDLCFDEIKKIKLRLNFLIYQCQFVTFSISNCKSTWKLTKNQFYQYVILFPFSVFSTFRCVTFPSPFGLLTLFS